MAAQPQAAANGNGKRPGRDPALTWEIPEAIDPAVQAQHVETCRAALDEVKHAHIEAIVRQLLGAERVQGADAWAAVVMKLATEAAEAVSPPALAASGHTDPRRLIKVKRLTGGGAMADSAVVHGIAFRKNVAHKRMRTRVEQPRIVTLAGALEYQRSKLALSSFDALIEPEKEYLQNAVGRLTKLGADVVLVERSVARYAQELLVEAGIVVALNVKPELLQRVATCTGGQLAASVEVLSEPGMGTCEVFEVESQGGNQAPTASDPPPASAAAPADDDAAMQTPAAAAPAAPAPKSLMLFRGCPHQIGATILLRGATTANELTKVKRAVAFAAYAAYWNRLEAAFLPEQLLAAKLSTSAMQYAVRASASITAKHRASTDILSASPHMSTYREPGECTEDVVDGDGQSSTPRETCTFSVDNAIGGEPLSLRSADELALAELQQGPPAGPTPDDPGQNADAAPVTHGTDIYRTQQLWLSISCRNPAKGVLCEAPHLHAMPFYREADLPLTAFIAAAAPPHRKCPHPQCGDGAAQHLRSFAHGDGLVTLSSMRLPAARELPDGEHGALWLWLRPLGKSAEEAANIVRLRLPPLAACISFAHLLALLIDARHMAVEDYNLQRGFARYLGVGPSVLCLHYTPVTPYVMRLPPRSVELSLHAESRWIHDEIKAITEEADDAFGTLEAALMLQLSALDATAAGSSGAWTDNLMETRGTFMDALGATSSLVGETLAGTGAMIMTDEGALVDAVRGINRLRRLLAWISQQWAQALSADIALPLLSPRTSQRTSGRGTADSVALERSGRQPHASDAIAIAFQPSYAAPKLAAAAVDAPTESPPRGEAIPAGLVARYVSLFEDKQLGLDRVSAEVPSRTTVVGATEPETLPHPGHRQPPAAPTVTIDLSSPARGTASRPLLQQGGDMKPLGEKIAELSAKLGQLSGLLRHHSGHHARPSSPVHRDSPEQEKHGTSDAAGQPALRETQTVAGGASSAEESAGAQPGHLPANTNFGMWKQVLSEQGRTGINVDEDNIEGSTETPASNSAEEQRGMAAASGGLLATPFTSGRALLPVGVDGACTTVYDEEPTSVVSYFSSTREYQDYVREAVRPHLPAIHDDHDIVSIPVQLDCQMLTEDASQPANRARFQMTAYYAPQFGALRRQCLAGGEAAFLASISRCISWNSQGGKSSVYFAKTRDDRYVIKQLSRAERQSFLGFAPDYFTYLSESSRLKRATALSRVFGVYQVSVHYPSGDAPPFGGREGVMDFLVMENLFYGRKVDRIYDLKGSSRDRYAAESGTSEVSVLMDENFRETSKTQPTLVAPRAHERVHRAIWSDTGFLSMLDVMDYSLLVGYDRDRHELVVGIIDYIRQYTWDKQVESWVKKSGILGGAGKEPTIISPRQYGRRFRAAMLAYFYVVPALDEPAAALDVDEQL